MTFKMPNGNPACHYINKLASFLNEAQLGGQIIVFWG